MNPNIPTPAPAEVRSRATDLSVLVVEKRRGRRKLTRLHRPTTPDKLTTCTARGEPDQADALNTTTEAEALESQRIIDHAFEEGLD